MIVDDIWFKPDTDKGSFLWNICRKIICTIIIALSKIWIGLLNTSVIHNESTLHHAVVGRRKGQGLITVLNHTSFLDGFLIPRFLKWRYILNHDIHLPWTPGAKEYLHPNSPQAMFFTLAKCLPIVRGDGVDQRTMDRLTEQLNKGEWVHIFPEGRILRRDAFIRYKWGVGRLIADCQVMPVVVPIYQVGMDEILPTGKSFIPKLGKNVTIVVGEPIDFKQTIKEMKKNAASHEELRKRITGVIQEKMRTLGQATKAFHSAPIEEKISF